ncbi:MAG: ATP F0F1 synthase subunit B [Pseudomonadota bacterium]
MDFLNNTDIVVAIGFLIFVGILIYVKVPKLITSKLDARADGIRAELEEARALREEAQTLLASYERRQREVTAQAEEIVTAARAEAEQAAAQAKEDLRASVDRRLATATEQIQAAEQAAIKDVKDRAVSVAVAAASEVIQKSMKRADIKASIESSIKEVGQKLH